MDSYEHAFSFEAITHESLDLARLLILEAYPLEVVWGLRDIADALIETQGFEPIFRECVARAKEHVEASHNGYNLPAVAA